jgi:hypothetical protein
MHNGARDAAVSMFDARYSPGVQSSRHRRVIVFREFSCYDESHAAADECPTIGVASVEREGARILASHRRKLSITESHVYRTENCRNSESIQEDDSRHSAGGDFMGDKPRRQVFTG